MVNRVSQVNLDKMALQDRQEILGSQGALAMSDLLVLLAHLVHLQLVQQVHQVLLGQMDPMAR